MLFLSKIRYKVQSPDTGKWKSIVEQFLHEAEQYNEVENIQLPEMLGKRVTDYKYDIIKIDFDTIYAPFVDGKFFAVKLLVQYGEDKPTVYKHLVVAEDVKEAERRCNDYVKNWTGSITIDAVDSTKILGYWHPNNQQWKDDFVQRTINLNEQLKAVDENGAAEKVPNQMSIFDVQAEESLDNARKIFHGMKADMEKKGYEVTVVKPAGEDDENTSGVHNHQTKEDSSRTTGRIRRTI